MKLKNYLQKVIMFFPLIFVVGEMNGQHIYIPADSTVSSILSFSFSGGSFESYGCDGLDPTFWLSGNGVSVTVNFVNPQDSPSFRVWGMNDDDSAGVSVNGVNYPIMASSASYDTKVICSTIFGSPGPDGVLFSGGLLVGANSNSIGNYSYQNITLDTTNVTSFTISGIGGAGWGFAGISIDNTVSINSIENEVFDIFPNPVDNIVNINGINNCSRIDVEVLNLIGQSVYIQRFNDSGNLRIDLSELESGTYFLLIKKNNASITKKLIKK